MISNFFVLSPRGDTILAKQYRSSSGTAAHERSHTEALFRKIKFWDDMASKDDQAVVTSTDSSSEPQAQSTSQTRTGDAPPVLLMQDGLTYFHVRRNGLIFGASTARNVSPNTVIEVSTLVNTVYVYKMRPHFRLCCSYSDSGLVSSINTNHIIFRFSFSSSQQLPGYSKIIVVRYQKRH